MKNLMKYSSMTLIAVASAACATPENTANNPAAFTDIEWTVQTIAGNDVLPNKKPTIRFGSDKTISGSATCNRLVGSYEMEGPKIDIDPLGTTMMLCAPSENMQERVFLDLIDDVEIVQVQRDGTLLMATDDGETMTAERTENGTSADNKAIFQCGDMTVVTNYSNSGQDLKLTVDGNVYNLPSVVSASGAKYEKNGVMFWSKGDWAMMEINGTTYSDCSMQ